MTTIEQRVAAGAKFLDEHDPDWWRADTDRAIDLDALRLQSYDRCILGQRCPLEILSQYTGIPVDILGEGDAPEKYDAFGRALSDDFREPGWPQQRGFNAWNNGEFDALTAEWRRVITERRSAS
jgi:hypothetical protein